MRLFFITSLFFFLILMGCRKDSTPPGIDGDWFLVSYQASAWNPGSVEQYSRGDVQWTFNLGAEMLEVVADSSVNYSLLPSGSHSIFIGTHPCGDEGIEINGQDYGAIDKSRLEQDSLVITNVCVDGQVLLFVR